MRAYLYVDGRQKRQNTTVTNASGEYELHVLPGKVSMRVEKAPDTLIPMESFFRESKLTRERRPTITISDDTDWPDLLLDPAGNLVLEVVDEAGQAVPNAQVKVMTPMYNGAPASDGRTDENGRYEIQRVALNDTLPIWVSTKEAISKPDLFVTPGKVDGPLRVVLTPDHGFRLGGQSD